MTHLTQEQIDQLKQLMQRRQTQLLNDIRVVVARTDDHLYGQQGDVPDTGDRSVTDLLVDLDNAEVHRDILEIRDIEAAQERMQQGNYGICLDCGFGIEYDRLTAFPTANRCVPCQAQHEKTHMNATPSL